MTTRGITGVAATLIAAGIVLTSTGLLVGQTPSPKGRRAAPPKFNSAEVSRIFYQNAFQEGLEGERPANLDKPAALVSASPAAPGAGGAGAAASTADSGGGGKWSGLISATTIEDEIKAIKLAADQQITTPSQFRGNGYKWVRRDYSVLAMLFAIICEYEGDVRWKSQAPVARDVFARTARNAKVGTDQVYTESKQRRDQLGDLLNGSQISGEAQPKVAWADVADRAPLMQRLETIVQGPLAAATANSGDFKSNKEQIQKSSELIAAVAQTLHQEGMPDAGDDAYDGFCKAMKQAAMQIADAVKLDNYEQARAAAGAINQACDKCHESYR